MNHAHHIWPIWIAPAQCTEPLHPAVLQRLFCVDRAFINYIYNVLVVSLRLLALTPSSLFVQNVLFAALSDLEPTSVAPSHDCILWHLLPNVRQDTSEASAIKVKRLAVDT